MSAKAATMSAKDATMSAKAATSYNCAYPSLRYLLLLEIAHTFYQFLAKADQVRFRALRLDSV